MVVLILSSISIRPPEL